MNTQDRGKRPRRGKRPGVVRAVHRELERAAADLALEGQRVLAAVSAGLDSTVLAWALAEIAPRAGFELCIGHVHHGLRGADAELDAEAAEALASGLGVAFARRRVNPQALREDRSSRTRPTLQEAARSARYAALDELAEELGATRIATAHHADDQAETVLLRLFRGTGPDGLGGIPERSADGRLVRPLLRLSRAEIRAYALAEGLAWREDDSNERLEYSRNRLRRNWLPGLSDDFNPRLLRAIADLAEAQRRDSEWIRASVDREAGTRLSVEGAWLRIDSKDWDELPAALARRLAREALVRAGASRDVERVHLERMLGFLRDGVSGSAIELPGGLSLGRDRYGFRLGPLVDAGRGTHSKTVC